VKWILRHRSLPVTLLAFAALGMMVMAQLAGASHVRPRGATPVRLPLVPAYKECTSANRMHGMPLASPSCSPPVQASSFLTLGTPDANGAGAHAIGFVLFKVVPASFNGELRITSTITDVRCMPATDAAACNSPNATAGPDYSGDLQANMTIRISDHYNGPNLDEAATVRDIPFPLNMRCTNTADTSTGGVCTITTACPFPEGCSTAGRRTVIEMGQLDVSDGGADGIVGTADNTVFMRQGIFIP
jgi:hypothetical protein